MNPLITAEKQYNMKEEACLLANQLPSLNLKQCAMYNTVHTSVNSDAKPTSFFLQGPEGTRKTFLYHALYHYYHSKGNIVLCMASSGIASLLLPGGMTAYS